MRKNLPYYITWTDQQSALTIPVKHTSKFTYTLDDNSQLIDLSSCSYHQSFGLRNKSIEDAITNQLSSTPLLGPKFTMDFKDKATNELLQLMKLKGKIFYTTSGSESVENALKVARDVSKKNYILRRAISYHGASIGSLSVTGDWRAQDFLSLSDYSITIPEPDEVDALKKTEQIIKEHHQKGIAAIILETITGGNGVIIPSNSWYKGIEALCKKYDILLILDEVVCGFYRTGKPFGYQHFELSPDIVCLSKSITGGYIPFGCVYTNSQIANYYQVNKLRCGLTNYAHPLGIAAMQEVLKICKSKGFVSNLSELVDTLDHFKKSIEKSEFIEDVRHIGLLMAIRPSKSFNIRDLVAKGFYINVTNNELIIAPIMTMTRHELDKALEELKPIILSK